MHRSMPVEEYGAALLRGMGWSGPDITTNSDNPSDGTLGQDCILYTSLFTIIESLR
jgi:G-patch domain